MVPKTALTQRGGGGRAAAAAAVDDLVAQVCRWS